MAKPTIKQQAEAALISAGFIRDPQARSLKFSVWIKPTQDGKWYLGTHGAIRFGRNHALSTPYSLAQLRVWLGPANR